MQNSQVEVIWFNKNRGKLRSLVEKYNQSQSKQSGTTSNGLMVNLEKLLAFSNDKLEQFVPQILDVRRSIEHHLQKQKQKDISTNNLISMPMSTIPKESKVVELSFSEKLTHLHGLLSHYLESEEESNQSSLKQIQGN